MRAAFPMNAHDGILMHDFHIYVKPMQSELLEEASNL